MADQNITTGAPVGVPMEIPRECINDIAVILRLIVAMSEEDPENLLNESYEVLARQLMAKHKNLVEIAGKIKEVTGYDH